MPRKNPTRNGRSTAAPFDTQTSQLALTLTSGRVTYEQPAQAAATTRLTVVQTRAPRVTEKGYRKGCVSPNKGRRYDGEPIPNDEEIVKLMEACDRRRLVGKRMYAHIAFLRGTGLRINESLDFLPGDLDLERGTVLVRCGKGGKRAKCGITPDAIRTTLDWMEIREAAGFTSSQPLFPVVEGPTRGRKIYDASIRHALRALAVKAGVEKRVHPHCFRHALALDLARRNVSLPVISRQLRHSSVATTATYLRKLDDDEVFDAVAEMGWMLVGNATA